MSVVITFVPCIQRTLHLHHKTTEFNPPSSTSQTHKIQPTLPPPLHKPTQLNPPSSMSQTHTIQPLHQKPIVLITAENNCILPVTKAHDLDKKVVPAVFKPVH